MTIDGILAGHLVSTPYRALPTLSPPQDHEQPQDMTTMHDYCSLGGEQNQQGPFTHPLVLK